MATALKKIQLLSTVVFAEFLPNVHFCILSALNGLRNGIFLDSGAFNGELASNSLPLEREYGWSGYLIEPIPDLYAQIVSKNRNVTSLNACISAEPRETLVSMISKGQQSRITKQTRRDTVRVPCFKFTSIMSAFKLQSIDYFSLDVEGVELAVLKTIPFDLYNIKILSIEHLHSPGGKKPITDYMLSKNYRLLDDIKFRDRSRGLFVQDLMFIKN